MIHHTSALRAAYAAALLCALAPVGAPAADDAGYAGKGTLVVQTSFGGDSKLTIGGDIAFEESDPYVRIDLLSLAIPGADPTLSSLMGTQLFPPGGFTVVYDRKDSTYVVWSTSKREYFAPPPKSSALAQATPAPGSSPPARSAASGGLFGVFGFLRSLPDDKVFALSIALMGHGQTNGHASTGIHFQYLKTTTAGDTTDFHGEMQLADDLNEIPIKISLSAKSKGLPQSALTLDATSIEKASPPQTDFAVPAGYARAASLGDVIGKVLPQ